MGQRLEIGVVGAAGRMGRMVTRTVYESSDCVLVAAAERPGSKHLGEDAGALAGVGPLGVAIGDAARPVFARAQVVIEFSLPGSTLASAALAAETGTPFVAGTTGLSPDQRNALATAGEAAPILWAPNMSVCVNLLFALVEEVAHALDDAYDIEVVEMHHRHKIDAPSGTALGLGQAAARGRGVAFEAVARLSREGETGARPAGEIGFATLRGGDVAGEHTVVFAGDGERLELTHRATDRRIFARGAVRAARWLHAKPPGLYTMQDMLRGELLKAGR